MDGGQAPVIAIGDASVDLVARLDVLPQPGRASTGGGMEWHIGGTALNFTVALSRLGTPALLLSKVGHDLFGDFILSRLKEEEVDTRFLLRSNLPTAVVVVLVDREGQCTFLAFRQACADTDLKIEEVDRGLLAKARAIYVSGIALVEAPTRETTLHALRIGREEGVTTVFDPNIRSPSEEIEEDFRGLLLEAVRLSDVFLPNESEWRVIFGGDVALEEVLAMGPRLIALKRGARGCLVSDGLTQHEIPVPLVEVVDTTGAGDVFDAAFVHGFLSGMGLRELGRFSNAAAALCTTRKGATTGVRGQEEIKALLADESRWPD